MDSAALDQLYRFFTEAGIITQLGGALTERHLPKRLTNQHFGFLGHLSRRPEGETPQKLAHAFQTPKTSMTHMIKVMEELGLVETRRNTEDARSKLIVITDAGERLRQEVLAKAVDDLAKMEPQPDMEAVARVLPDLEHLRAQLDAARDG